MHRSGSCQGLRLKKGYDCRCNQRWRILLQRVICYHDYLFARWDSEACAIYQSIDSRHASQLRNCRSRWFFIIWIKISAPWQGFDHQWALPWLHSRWASLKTIRGYDWVIQAQSSTSWPHLKRSNILWPVQACTSNRSAVCHQAEWFVERRNWNEHLCAKWPH